MGWGQSKESGATEDTRKEQKSMKWRVDEENIEQSKVVKSMRTISQSRHFIQPPATSGSNEATGSGTIGRSIKYKGAVKDEAQSSIEIAQPPVQDSNQQSDAATTSAINMSLGSHCEEEAVVEVEEKKLVIVSNTSKSYYLTTTAPESFLFSETIGAALETIRENEGTQEESECSQKNLERGSTGQNQSDHTSEMVQRKRHKHHGE